MNQDEQFRSRVEQLVAEGKLTADEAAKLVGAPARTTSAADEGVEDVNATSGTDEASGSLAATSAAPVRTEVMSYRYDGEVPSRLYLNVQGFSLTVRVDHGVTQPMLTASQPDRLELVGSPQGWRVSRTPLQWEEKGSNWLERVLNGFTQEGNLRADLVIPADMAEVTAKVQGGNLTLDPLVATVDAVVQGGNLTLADALGVQAKVQGGNLKWRATLNGGQHSVKVQGGNLNLELGAASSVRFRGDVVAGNLSASGLDVTKTSRDFVSASYEGVLGEGNAHLDLKVQGGNARLVTV
ncbi:hypothetical protein [Deinococcus yavapaiensis]|uniref:Adhesin n=1 Tax=Deinococcus yavapaiensis KR-236 TaxID=694435 RepID=A0A318SH87_9DEIO|nr:hypothetical protein [Deinococcus yavapaiensis]PYE50021.1 hypothetical protein DES52_11942 [Deinococcus yavapaiensis KR-236]